MDSLNEGRKCVIVLDKDTATEPIVELIEKREGKEKRK
jgi:hypothetical protein